MESRVSGCTATGLQLIQRLNGLIGGLLQNDIPAVIGKRISAAIDDADSRMARQAALKRLCKLLSAGETQSRWQLAQRLESALVRFSGTPHMRIKAGYREPSEIERHLMTLLETDGPRCASKLWAELGSFGLPG